MAERTGTAKKRTWKSRIKQSWNAFQAEKTGRRFQSRYNQEHRTGGVKLKAVVQIGMGVLLLIAGGIMLVIPGPGIPVIAFGAVLIARHVNPAAKALDWIDVHLRRAYRAVKREWKEAPTVLRSLMIAGAVAAVGFAGYGAANVLLR